MSPQVDITDEQQEALDRGEPVTLYPSGLHIAVHKGGDVYMVRGPLNYGEWKMLRSADRYYAESDYDAPDYSEWSSTRIRYNFVNEVIKDHYTITKVDS